MKWSWKLGRFSGIDTYVHASFLLLVAWAAWAAYAGAGTGLAAIFGVVFLVGVFGSVLLHELGHALVARRYGIQTRRIILLPIGGLAQLEGEPETPKQELAVALAGPAVNLVIAFGLFFFSAIGMPSYFGLAHGLMIANLSLAVFNLIPAFPMDGGRALRAFLSMRMGHVRATRIAADIGKAAAFALGIIGLFTNFMLVLVAGFVWFAAHAESKRLDAYASPWGYDGDDGYEPVRVRVDYAGPGHAHARPQADYVDAPWTAWRREAELSYEERLRAAQAPAQRGDPRWQRSDLGPRRVIIFGRPFWVR